MHQALGKWMAAAVVVAMLATATPVMAKNGIYLGAGVGRTTLEIDDLDVDLSSFDYKADSTTTKIIAGYRFMGFVAVEGSYIDFGSLSDSADVDGETVRIETDLTGFDLCAMGMLPIGFADVFVKGGFVSWEADIEAAFDEITELDVENGTDLVYGVGAQVRFSGFAVRAELEYFDISDADSLYLVSVAATYTF